MNERKDYVEMFLHLINNDISLIGGNPSAPALDGMSAPDDYKFLKLFFSIDPDMAIRISYNIIVLSSALKTYVNFEINLTSRSR